MPFSPRYRPAPRLLDLGSDFADTVEPARFPRHDLRFRNQPWARRLGLGALDAREWERHFARLEPLPENLPRPLALRYHGHQFLVYNPNLGDGRGFVLAELEDPEDGRLLDLGTKGSGRTPWSRSGDGRLTLKGGVREVLATEMLEALGVYTSKTLSLFETGESLERGDEPSPTRSSVLVRICHSLIRFGTFQRLAYFDDRDGMRRLLEYSVEHYFPHLERAREDLPVAMFREVGERSARLCGRWMAAGFVHGVLNTDNMNLTGESFDYGPYRFLPVWDPEFVAAYFDPGGVYAFGRQPQAVHWNLAALADALTRISTTEPLRTAWEEFPARFRVAFRAAFLDRLGVAPLDDGRDDDLVATTQELLVGSRVGVDRFFFDWYGGPAAEERATRGPAALHYQGEIFDRLRELLSHRSPIAGRRLEDDYFRGEGPCTLLIDEIEAIWSQIAEHDDWSAFERKIAEIRAMARSYGRGVAEDDGSVGV